MSALSKISAELANNMASRSNRPAYLQVADKLRQQIISGILAEETQLPTIDQFARHMPVSRMTLVRAIQLLRDQGLLITRGKGGTWVAADAAKPRIGLFGRLDFNRPGHAEFTYTLTNHIRQQLVAQNFIPFSFNDTPPVICDNPSYDELCEATKTGAISGLIDVFTRFPVWHESQQEPLDVPMVHVGVQPAPQQVFFDTVAAINSAVNLLRNTDYRTIGLIGNLPPQQKWLLDKNSEHKTETRPQWIVVDHCQTGEEFGFQALHKIWLACPRPRAIFVSDDVIAQGVAQAALALRINVPQELLITCMGNEGIDRFYPCPVIRIDLSLNQLAAAAVKELTNMLKNNTRNGTPKLISTFNVRTADIPTLTHFTEAAKLKQAM